MVGWGEVCGVWEGGWIFLGVGTWEREELRLFWRNGVGVQG